MAVHSRPTLLLTRPRAASERFARGLEGFDVVTAPLMEIAPTGFAIDLEGIAGLILTSENAVPFLPRSSLPAFCVGPRTAEAAALAGLQADVVGPDADGLVAGLIARAPKGPLLHVHGAHTRGDVVARLTAAGLQVRGQVAYTQQDFPPDARFHAALLAGRVIVPLFSPRSAQLFAKASPQAPETATVLAMSQAVKAALSPSWQSHTQVISQPTGAEMRKALEPFGLRPNSP